MIPRQPVVVKRLAAGSYTDGVWTDGASTDVNITASIQPLTARQMLLLPEGRRNTTAYNLFTSSRLFTAEPATNTNADKVILPDGTYEVFSCESWQNGIINHYKAVVTRIVS